MAAGARIFYYMGALILIITVWTALETPWSRLDDEISFALFLNLIIGISLAITELAVGWLISKQPKT